jgi:formylmethanofuran dehydrogenase subunit E
MKTLAEYLVDAERNHGHMCPGQVLGVRMAMSGSRAVGIDDPTRSRELIVFVEIDRCAADAINTVTGCRLGRRTLKFRDYGKLAATFVNTRTGDAVRVVALENSRRLAADLYAHLETKKERQMAAYKELNDEKLFSFEKVRVNLDERELPGHPLTRVACDSCGEGVNDGREVERDGRVLCRACAGDRYYEPTGY